MIFPLSVGATTVLWPPRPSPDGVFEIMRKHRPTIFYGVPSLYTALLAHPDIGKGAGSDRLRICVSAGEALPAHIGERWREVVGVDVLDGIGSTEMLQTFLSNRPGDIRYGSTGKPVPGYETRIVDEHGRELGTDEIGELIVRGPTPAKATGTSAPRAGAPFAGEWTYTGDKYRRDADGYYYYCGRTDDMFKVSGMWVSPFDVEAALVSHEAVLEAAVIGKQDADGLVKPKAFIVLKNGYVADEQPAGNAEGPRQGAGRPVEISALDRRAQRPAAHRHRQDPALQAARRGCAAREIYPSFRGASIASEPGIQSQIDGIHWSPGTSVVRRYAPSRNDNASEPAFELLPMAPGCLRALRRPGMTR